MVGRKITIRIARERVFARGHPNIKGSHRTTIEITKDAWLTPRGDCIIGISANKALKDFNPLFKYYARHSKTRIIVVLKVGSLKEVIAGYGHPNLTYESATSIVIRKSTYTCPRTLMIRSNKSAVDIDRRIIKALRLGAKLIVDFYAIPPPILF